MAEISLGDLLAWEPRLRVWRPVLTHLAGQPPIPPAATVGDDRELTWAVSTRASMPMLPPLRGGEVILINHSVALESGVSMGPLLQQITAHGATALIVDEELAESHSLPNPTPLPVLTLFDSPVSNEFETEINRLLTERRGEMYRAGIEIGRALGGLMASGAGLEAIVETACQVLSVRVRLVDVHGHELVASSPADDRLVESDPTTAQSGGDETEIPVVVELGSSMRLQIGPVRGDQRPLVRMMGERIGEAVETALRRTPSSRPSGQGRAEALADLLVAPASRAVSEGFMRTTGLGLSATAHYRVALSAPEVSLTVAFRLLASLGRVHEAGTIDGASAAVIELHRGETSSLAIQSIASLATAPNQPNGKKQDPLDDGWLAISGAVSGVVELTAAARQARYLGALVQRDLVPGPVVRFDVLDDIGAYRLLYHLWGTRELQLFASQALGDLDRRDQRGTLRASLLKFLETGGSHVDAAARLRIHRNTLAYRLRQIRALTGHDPTDPGTRLVLNLALLAQSLPPVPID